jgi:EAL domain-containing protein (putative c-di-GMP-specific phosphodiesterase class I)
MPALAKSRSAPMSQESAMLDFVERLRKFTKGRRAVHVRLSKLRPYNRRAHHLRVAGSAFDPLVRDYDGAFFRFFNNDLVIICNGADVADMDHTILHLQYLFADDPLIKNSEDGNTPFCTWFDLEDDYGDLLDLAKRMVSARTQYDQGAANTQAPVAKKAEPKEPAKVALSPLDPPNLAALEESIAQADLSTIIRRQPICAVVRDSKPQPVYHEIYTSISSLCETLMPGIDVQANPWLFQDLTQHLDRRMISYLTQNGDATRGEPFSVNINVSTLLSPEFLDFDAVLNPGIRGGIVLELQLFDVYADLGSFLFARDFLHERGYKFCLDATTHMSLPLVNREELGFDLVKLFWSDDLGDRLSGVRGKSLREAAKKIGSERLILAHCDSEQALEAGDSLGITLYQGYLLDEMLASNITRKESIDALTEALQRHRAAER